MIHTGTYKEDKNKPMQPKTEHIYRKIADMDSIDRGRMKELIAQMNDNLERHILLEEEYDYMISQKKFYVAAQIGSYLKELEHENRILDLRMNMLAGLMIQ